MTGGKKPTTRKGARRGYHESVRFGEVILRAARAGLRAAPTVVTRSFELSGRGWGRNTDWGQPAVAVGFLAAGEGEKFVLDALGDGGTGAVSHREAIDGADG